MLDHTGTISLLNWVLFRFYTFKAQPKLTFCFISSPRSGTSSNASTPSTKKMDNEKPTTPISKSVTPTSGGSASSAAAGGGALKPLKPPSALGKIFTFSPLKVIILSCSCNTYLSKSQRNNIMHIFHFFFSFQANTHTTLVVVVPMNFQEQQDPMDFTTICHRVLTIIQDPHLLVTIHMHRWGRH